MRIVFVTDRGCSLAGFRLPRRPLSAPNARESGALDLFRETERGCALASCERDSFTFSHSRASSRYAVRDDRGGVEVTRLILLRARCSFASGEVLTATRSYPGLSVGALPDRLATRIRVAPLVDEPGSSRDDDAFAGTTLTRERRKSERERVTETGVKEREGGRGRRGALTTTAARRKKRLSRLSCACARARMCARVCAREKCTGVDPARPSETR